MVTDLDAVWRQKLIQAVRAKDWEKVVECVGVDDVKLTPAEEAEAWAACMRMLDEQYGHLPADEPMPEFAKHRLLAYWKGVRKQVVALDYMVPECVSSAIEIWLQLEPLMEKIYPDYELSEWQWILAGQGEQAKLAGRYDEAEMFWEIGNLINEIDLYQLEENLGLC